MGNNNHDVQQAAKNALAFTSEMIDQCGPRLAGDQSTLKASHILRERWAKFTDSSAEEPFFVHPKSFLGWIRILVVFYLISVIAAWYNLPIVGGILMAAGLAIMVLQFFFYKELIDPL